MYFPGAHEYLSTFCMQICCYECCSSKAGRNRQAGSLEVVEWVSLFYSFFDGEFKRLKKRSDFKRMNAKRDRMYHTEEKPIRIGVAGSKLSNSTASFLQERRRCIDLLHQLTSVAATLPMLNDFLIYFTIVCLHHSIPHALFSGIFLCRTLRRLHLPIIDLATPICLFIFTLIYCAFQTLSIHHMLLTIVISVFTAGCSC